MCLVVLALGVSSEVPFALAANRDEYFARPAAAAAWWRHEGCDIFGGRDLERGGTWLGLTREGRIAVVTNVRDAFAVRTGKSRGWLVRDALVAKDLPPVFAHEEERPAYNVLVGEKQRNELFYLRDGAETVRVSPGIHGLSNHRLDTPWPKVAAATAKLANVAHGDRAALFRILAEEAPATDSALPKTGVPLEVERALSPAFVRLPTVGYGTRCSTVVIRHKNGSIDFEERTFDPSGTLTCTVRERIG